MHLPNPVTSDPRVGRLLEGVKKTRRAVHFDDVRSSTAQPTLTLTPQMLREMAPHAARSDSPRLAMLWAAVCLGTFGLQLRMNELLGSPQHPERALRVAQVRFCRTPAGLPAPFPPEGSASTPDHFVVDLLATNLKADQHGANAPLSIAAPLAVTAMWRWSIARRLLALPTPSAGTAPEYLFARPGEKSVTLRQITDYLKVLDTLEALGHGRPHITGKAFRRGGASALVASNTPVAAAAAAGRWKSHAMPLVYANQAAKQSQSLEISRAMSR